MTLPPHTLARAAYDRLRSSAELYAWVQQLAEENERLKRDAESRTRRNSELAAIVERDGSPPYFDTDHGDSASLLALRQCIDSVCKGVIAKDTLEAGDYCAMVTELAALVPSSYRGGDCALCDGAGWVWRHELSDDGWDGSADDTKYECPECNAGSVTKSRGRTHELKCWPMFFDCVANGSKTFEVRRDDRDFKAGDTLILREFDGKKAGYTGRMVRRLVTFVLPGGEFGIDPEFCVMSLQSPPIASAQSSSQQTPGACSCSEVGEVRPTYPDDHVPASWMTAQDPLKRAAYWLESFHEDLRG